MKTKKYPSVTLCNAVCAILMVVLLILQFTPFWELEGEPTSISSYIWVPSDHADLTTHFEKVISSDYSINSMVMPAILQLVLPVAGIALFLYRKEGIWAGIISVFAGLSGFWAYLGRPAYRLGSWQAPFAVSVLLLIAGVLTVLAFIKKNEWYFRKAQ